MSDSQRRPLEGYRVLDLATMIAAPLCAGILGEFGAEVIKIEMPGKGDALRSFGTMNASGSSFNWLNEGRNKKSITLDVRTPQGLELFKRLVATSDVVVENFRPGTLEKWGLGYDTLSQAFPRLVHCRVSGFGADGPLGGLPGYDACAQAMCGLMSVNGEAGGEATRVGLPVVDMVTGLNAAVAVLLALNERHRSGLGQFLDITLYDCALSLLHPHAANYFYSGKTPARTGNAHPNIAPYETLPTASGPIFLAVGNNRQFALLAQALEAPALAADPRFAFNADRLRNRDALRAELSALLARHEAAALADRLLRHGVPAAAVQTVDQALAHPHTRHRGMVLEQGEYRGVGSPIKLSRTPATLRKLPPELAPPAET